MSDHRKEDGVANFKAFQDKAQKATILDDNSEMPLLVSKATDEVIRSIYNFPVAGNSVIGDEDLTEVLDEELAAALQDFRLPVLKPLQERLMPPITLGRGVVN